MTIFLIEKHTVIRNKHATNWLKKDLHCIRIEEHIE
jgi:hypothetical protein